nr:SAM-dependent methyltransferase [Rhodococcus sp. (in: high G+C Gram-positive bacteria)]
MSLSRDYFDAVYTDNVDPFRLQDNWYETRKYAITMASLPRRSYRRALEPGCSIGILTAELSARCESLVSTDVAPAALEIARSRVGSDRVQFLEWSLTGDWDAVCDGDTFDLVVLSEVGYYLDESDLRSALDSAVSRLDAGGTLLAAHWRHPVADYPLSGDQVHAVVGATSGLTRIGGYVDEDVILEVFECSTERPDSVARIEGLV